MLIVVVIDAFLQRLDHLVAIAGDVAVDAVLEQVGLALERVRLAFAGDDNLVAWKLDGPLVLLLGNKHTY